MTDTPIGAKEGGALLGPSGRPRNLLFEALCEVCGIDWTEATKGELGRVTRACKDLKDVGATPEDVVARAAEYRRKWPNIDVTPTGISNNWSQLKPEGRVRLAPPRFERPDDL